MSRFTWAAAAAVCTLAMASPALAIPVFTFTGGTATGAFDNRTQGYNFFTGRDTLSIFSLGYWDENGDGLEVSHEVGIWSADGSTLLASAVVPAGTAGFLDSGFRFVSITPVVLAAGQQYLAGGFNGTGDSVVRFADATSHDPNVTLGSTRFDPAPFTGVFTAPTGTQGTNFDDGYFGPNFNGGNPVPEPATWALMILGFGVAGAALRRRRTLRLA